VNQIVHALFALNRKYLLNDKTALAEIREFELVPREFGSRVQKTLASLGESEASLEVAVKSVEELLRESVALAQKLYRSRMRFLGNSCIWKTFGFFASILQEQQLSSNQISHLNFSQVMTKHRHSRDTNLRGPRLRLLRISKRSSSPPAA
jgi:hypothetical protein